MTKEQFDEQMTRLIDTYPQSAYPAERVKQIYVALRSCPDWQFEAVVTHFIANNRSAPMLKDFVAEIADMDRKARKYNPPAGTGSQLGLMKSLEERNRSVDKDFVAHCMKTLTDFTQGKLTSEQFQQACDMLDDAAENYGNGACVRCNSSGFVTQGGHLCRCLCSFGRAQPSELVLHRTDNTVERSPIPDANFVKEAEC